jgi:hypothetical protein
MGCFPELATTNHGSLSFENVEKSSRDGRIISLGQRCFV